MSVCAVYYFHHLAATVLNTLKLNIKALQTVRFRLTVSDSNSPATPLYTKEFSAKGPLLGGEVEVGMGDITFTRSAYQLTAWADGYYSYYESQPIEIKGSVVKDFVLSPMTSVNGVSVEGEIPADAVRYNISGQRVGQGAHGMVIVNGKKFLTK